MSSVLLKRTIAAIERLAPLRLAEKWDNVGLLVESPIIRENANNILLTIDLTTAVCEEALSTPTAVIVSYHPPLFRPLSSLTLSNPLQASLLKCAAAGISVFSPHTAFDSAKDGINDWLASGLGSPSSVSVVEQKIGEDEGVGIGRVVKLSEPVSIQELTERIKQHLGLQHVQLATTRNVSDKVSSIAICAGSGSSVISKVKADVLWTGEMSHHEVLAAVAQGSTVILCGHTNTERGYLPTLQKRLTDVLKQDTQGEEFQVIVSSKDRDPLEIV